MSSWSISARIFHHFYPTFKPSFFYFTHSQLKNNQDKTQDIIVLAQDNKHRLHRTQDRRYQDGLTASFYRLLDYWTIEGHVKLLDSPLSHQLVDPSMLLHHILDLTGFYQFHNNHEAGRILPDEDRPRCHDPVKDPLHAPPPVEPGLQQLRH